MTGGSVVLALCLGLSLAAHDSFRVIFQWNYVDFAWPSDEARQRAVDRGEYVLANNPIAGIKCWKGKMYLTIPRWKDGVPVTLAVTPSSPVNGVTAPRLEPFPSWEMQTLGDCDAFQFVQSMEIDPAGRMWVLDTGRTATQTLEAKARCPPRLVILDLENGGAVLRSFRFPADVTPPDSVYLNDIVLDHEDGGVAYITDSSREDPGIVVYSLANDTAWKVRHDSMKAKAEAVGFMVAKTHVISPINVDGIALSPAGSHDRQVYYTPLSSFHLYSIPVSVLKNRTDNVDRYVRELGRKNSQTDGMAMSMSGVLYFGLLADDAVAMWDTKHMQSFTTGQRVISRDHALMQWPDTFAFDEEGNLWCVTNSVQNFLNNRVDVSQPNYRVIKMHSGTKSYQYLEDGSVPDLPTVTAGARRAARDLSALAALFAALLAAPIAALSQ
ncbi:protein yellow-like [Orussus abietinus]|uniref:protein yellow-like n=1 Tax=Orussus abietinus TaxID=222816 RepID=UPI0006257A41|nr:protein yellow-like [Orussus abietinus]